MTKIRHRRTAPRRAASAGQRRSLKAVAIVGGGLLGTYLAVKVMGNKSTPPAGSGAAVPPPAGSTTLLKRGQSSAQVKLLQQALLKLGGEPARLLQAAGGADGNYGPATERALAAAGFRQPSQVNTAAYQAVLKKASAQVTATKTATAKALAPPLAVAPPVAATPAPRKAANSLPAAGLPLPVATATQLRSSLIHAALAADLAKLVSVMKYLRSAADWDQVVHGKNYQTWTDAKGRSLDANIIAQFGSNNPYISQQLKRLGLVSNGIGFYPNYRS